MMTSNYSQKNKNRPRNKKQEKKIVSTKKIYTNNKKKNRLDKTSKKKLVIQYYKNILYKNKKKNRLDKTSKKKLVIQYYKNILYKNMKNNHGPFLLFTEFNQILSRMLSPFIKRLFLIKKHLNAIFSILKKLKNTKFWILYNLGYFGDIIVPKKEKVKEEVEDENFDKEKENEFKKSEKKLKKKDIIIKDKKSGKDRSEKKDRDENPKSQIILNLIKDDKSKETRTFNFHPDPKNIFSFKTMLSKLLTIFTSSQSIPEASFIHYHHHCIVELLFLNQYNQYFLPLMQ